MDLNSNVSELPFVGPAYEKRLNKLGIATIADLLYHVPHRYLDFSLTSKINQARVDETLTIKGNIVSIKNIYTKFGKKFQLAEIADSTGIINVVWFNQPFLVQTFNIGEKIAMAGKVGWFGRKIALISPEYEKIISGKKAIHTGRIIPIYPETSGISSKWLRSRIENALPKVKKQLAEYLPKSILKSENLLTLYEAINKIHHPEDFNESVKAKKRLAFDEFLKIYLGALKRKSIWQKNKTLYALNINKKILSSFINSLPFSLTDSQTRSINEIVDDLGKPYPMNRLLEGDVGSGKTIVAASAAFISFINGYQTVFMAPTQILAQQHYETLEKIFTPFKLRISLVTSEITKKDLGRADIIIGTHALLYKSQNFDRVALVIIDEQHRFGVEQRAKLVKIAGQKKLAPHVLTMTATPIPRTIALSLYGDLDLSTLSDMPLGRQKITTWVVPPIKRNGAYEWIKKEIKNRKIQVFIVCPLIEESESLLSVKAAKKEFSDLQKTFVDFKLGLLHGKQSAKEKNLVLNKFKNKKIDILVTTPVVEVGIDMPNATIMIIEEADRFGLAQLHQLRGRVGRSNIKSYCLLFSQNQSPKVLTRLKAMEKGLTGFELAELDLKLRGPGEVFGIRQHGFPDLKIASWQDIDLLKKAKKIAITLTNQPDKYRLVLEYLGPRINHLN